MSNNYESDIRLLLTALWDKEITIEETVNSVVRIITKDRKYNLNNINLHLFKEYLDFKNRIHNHVDLFNRSKRTFKDTIKWINQAVGKFDEDVDFMNLSLEAKENKRNEK